MNLKRFFATALLLAAPAVPLHDATAQKAAGAAPQRLRDTGLFVGDSGPQIARGIIAFSPQYPLWSDAATKRRWMALPPGTFIDATKPDAWEFPRGTRFWKEFSVGRPVETRFIERLQDGAWRYSTYVWNESGTDAVLAPTNGVTLAPRAGERRYVIPSEADCRACHEGGTVPVLGFSALQLSSDRDPLAPHAEPVSGVDLHELVARGWLRNLPQRMVEKPPRIAGSTPTERAALGYLHANCGHCHGKPDKVGASVPVAVMLAQSVADPNSAADVLRSLIKTRSRYRPAGVQQDPKIVEPGAAHASVLLLRMSSRDPHVQMPPLGTEIADPEAVALIERWINILGSPKDSKP